MNSTTEPARYLSGQEALARVALSAAIALTLLGLRLIDPAKVAWFPLHTSCGAFTGLPCIFCGTTRAMHHLLLGDFARALYFNWIAFPIAALALAVVALCVAELVAQRRLLVARLRLRVTPKTLAWSGGMLAALWILQVSLAVSLHKAELLNPDGLLYVLFVK
jgi:hypothetical protein